MNLRQRNRRRAMADIQRSALDIFTTRGFDAVTVADIATETGVAQSTVYRYFGTKEAIVLWDEHEATLDEALGRELGRQQPLAAMRKVFVHEWGDRYDTDLKFQLRRVKYIYATEQLHAAAVEAHFSYREELTAALQDHLKPGNRERAPLLAGAALLALDVALERWQQLDARRPLGFLIDEAFEHLAHLNALR